VEAKLQLGRVYEDPSVFLHGGITALLPDEVLGRAALEAHRYGLTAGLNIRYCRRVPLRTPIIVRAGVSDETGRRTTVTGTIASAAEPETTLPVSGLVAGLFGQCHVA
jgi:acyl-coenzyme A thioesterase PaaI-like protein